MDLYGINVEVIEFNKLVRDRIPDLIREGGERVNTVELRGEALILALRRKLVEEALEAMDAASGDDLLSELADLLEVIRSLSQHLHVSPADLRQERIAKYKRRGGFRDGLMLKTTATQRSLTTQTDQQLPGINPLIDQSRREAITAVADLPRAGFYRRPDLRKLNESTVENLLTFETSIVELASTQPMVQRFSFTLPAEEGGQRGGVMSIELERDRSTLRCVVRLRSDRIAARPDNDSQLQLDFGSSA